MATLELLCIIEGESASNAFKVQIESTVRISTLKDEIKHKMEPEFDGITASRLSLWRVSIAKSASEEIMGDVFGGGLNEGNKLSPLQRLQTLFPQGAEPDVIHIVVRPPCKRSLAMPCLSILLTPSLQNNRRVMTDSHAFQTTVQTD